MNKKKAKTGAKTKNFSLLNFSDDLLSIYSMKLYYNFFLFNAMLKFIFIVHNLYI